MTYKVIQWATGEIGSNALRGIVHHPDLELVGTWVHSDSKSGRDAGEICGIDPVGVTATSDKQAIIDMPADAVCFAVGRTWMADGQDALIDELCGLLRSGKNVINATWPSLINPKGIRQDIYDKLQQACLDGGSSFYTEGIDPGLGSSGLAMTALSASSNPQCVHMYEILNYASWDAPQMLTFFGFGQKELGQVATPGYLTEIFRSTLWLVADAMGIELEDIVEKFDVIHADEALELPAVTVALGTISGVRFRVIGLAGGKERVIVDHVTKLRDQDFPEVPFNSGGGYRAEVIGEPSVKLDMELLSEHKDHAHAALAASAMTLVNAIPQVCEAAPGVLTYRDLKPHPAKMRVV